MIILIFVVMIFVGLLLAANLIPYVRYKRVCKEYEEKYFNNNEKYVQEWEDFVRDNPTNDKTYKEYIRYRYGAHPGEYHRSCYSTYLSEAFDIAALVAGIITAIFIFSVLGLRFGNKYSYKEAAIKSVYEQEMVDNTDSTNLIAAGTFDVIMKHNELILINRMYQDHWFMDMMYPDNQDWNDIPIVEIN